MAQDLRARFCQAAVRVPNLPNLPVIREELLENERINHFLQWFCDDVYSTNVLTADELAKYQVIQSSEKVAQRDQLEDDVRRMENFGCISTEDLSTEQLRREISDLQLDVVEARDHLDTLFQVKTQLDRHYTDLLHKKDSIQASERSYQQLHQGKLYSCKKENAKLNKGLEQLKSTVGDTMELYKQTEGEMNCYGDSKPSQQSPFLSAYSLDSYHSMEGKFTQSLVAYTKKQFFQGIANLSDDGSDNDNVERVLTMDGEVREMERLQAVYPISEVKRINTLTEEQQLMAASGCAEGQIMLLSQASYNTSDDKNIVKAQVRKLQEELSIVNSEIKKLGHEKLPVLVQELTKLKFIRVFSTDHDLKLARQDYFTSKQDKVIDYLRDQLSRHELLLMMYEVELRRHRELHMLLKAIQSQLITWKDEHDRKIKMLQEMPQVSTAQPHQVISPLDKVSSGVYKLLEDNRMTKATLVPTFPDLLSSCKQLVNHVENLTNACEVLQIDKLQQTTHLQHMVLQYEDLLGRCNVLVDSDCPIAISKEVSDTFDQLTALIIKLETELRQLMKEFNSRKMILTVNPWLQKERVLFVHFFTDPAKLQQMFSELVTTVDSHSLLQSQATV